jgi:two-component system LytT family response regulator
VIAQKDVIYWGSDGGLTKLYSAGQSYLMEPTLIELERRLDPAVFCRISRTVIVNLDYVSEVNMLLGGYGEALLKTGERLGVSRRRLRILMAKLEGKS